MPELDIYTNFWRYASLIFVSRTTMQQWHNNLNNDRLYQKIRTAILDLERWYEQGSGTPARDETYVGWFDAIPAMYEKTDDASPTTIGK